MRGVLALAFASLVMAGCASQQVDSQFAAWAIKAPDLLATDMGPDGALTRMEGDVSMTMSMPYGDTLVHLTMSMTMTQTFYQGGAQLATVDIGHAQADGRDVPMAVSMEFFCSPQRLVVRSHGNPNGSDLNASVPNPVGKCRDSDGSLPGALAASGNATMDPKIVSALESMLHQSAAPKMTLSHTLRESGANYAIYDTTMSLGALSTGGSGSFHMQTRATIENARITYQEVSGGGDVSLPGGDATATAHADVSGHQSFSYGERGPAPSEYS